MAGEQVESVSDALARVSETLGAVPKVCILGGTSFNDPDSEAIVRCLARELSGKFGDGACALVTGGMAGVQKTFAEACVGSVRLYNLLPFGQASGFGAGTDIFAGKDLNERKEAFGLLGDVYITVEGGPGVAGEARAAVARGARVVPLVRTGGASGGMFDFPAEALQKPGDASEEHWSALTSKAAPAAVAAEAAAAMVAQYVEAARMHLYSATNGDTEVSPAIPRDIRKQIRFLRKKLHGALARQGDAATEALAASGEKTVADQLTNIKRLLLQASERKLQEESEDDADGAAGRAVLGGGAVLQEQLAEYERKIADMKEELMKYRHQASTSQALEKAYVEEISQLQRRIAEADEAAQSWKLRSDGLQAEAAAATQEIARLAESAGVVDQTDALRQAEEAAMSFAQRVEELEARDKAHAAEIAVLQQQLMETAEASASAAKMSSDQAAVEFEKLAADSELRVQQVEARERALMSEVDELQAQTAQAQREAETLRACVTELEARDRVQGEEVAMLRQRTADLESRTIGEAETNSMKARSEELEQRNQQLEGMLMELRVKEQANLSKIDELRRKNGRTEEFQAQLSEADQLVKETAARMQELQHEVEEAVRRAQTAEARSFELQAEIDAMRQEKQELEAGVVQYEERNVEMEALIKSMAERETRLAQMEEELKNSRSSLGSPRRQSPTAASPDIAALEEKVRLQDNEIGNLKQELAMRQDSRAGRVTVTSSPAQTPTVVVRGPSPLVYTVPDLSRSYSSSNAGASINTAAPRGVTIPVTTPPQLGSPAAGPYPGLQAPLGAQQTRIAQGDQMTVPAYMAASLSTPSTGAGLGRPAVTTVVDPNGVQRMYVSASQPQR